tara:strand:+ start:446 stop:3073 length:2628 start_codon:yes stop_codon:yes gene_type:complete
MPAVTQRISNYLGGVSKQSDDKMLPGQVRESYNGYPDATYGMTKRPGFKHIANLGTGTTLDNAKWFNINRDDDEEYFGCIKGSDIYIWNGVSGAVCTVTYGTGAQSYLNGTRNNYKLLTVQDTTIVINNGISVLEQGTPTITANSQGTVVLSSVVPNAKYYVTIQGVEFQVTAHSTDATFDDLLTQKAGHNLKDAIVNGINANSGNANFSGTWTVVRNGSYSLDITRTVSGTATAFTLEARGGLQNSNLTAFQNEVGSIGELPIESYNGHTVKIINTTGTEDDYYAAFTADNGTDGRGYWIETISPNASPGLDNSTMPHELINTSINNFVFQRITYTDRLVGDDETNSHPSFVGEKITAGFFHNNRLGFLSKDNVCLSQSGKYYNFYFESAQTVIDSDPVDISCSSIRPTALHAVLPTAQGVVLFSEKQQFVLFSDSGVLTPSLSTIRTISNYEMDSLVDPVDVGTNINFISKTPGYTRVFSMVTKGMQEPPQVLDLSRVVKEWITADIDLLVSSPQNSMIALSSQSSNEVYLFRYYSDGKENLMETWTSWVMPGTNQYISITSDDMYAVTKQGSQYTLSKAALSQSPEDAIIVSNNGQKVNPCIDLYATASSVVFDSTNNLSKCYLPYDDVTTLTPVIVIKGNVSTGSFVESGFTITPERSSDGTGPYFIVPNKDLTSVASDVVVGFKYNFDLELPTTYFRPERALTDFTANLTIARMKFSVGLSGVMTFKVKQNGRIPYELSFTGDGTTTTFPFNRQDLEYIDRTDVKVTVNGIATTAFTFTNSTTIEFTSAPTANSIIKFYIDEWFLTNPVIEANNYLANDVPLDNETVFSVPIHQRTENFKVRLFNNSPFPVALNAMMWEGNYTPRFYRRK